MKGFEWYDHVELMADNRLFKSLYSSIDKVQGGKVDLGRCGYMQRELIEDSNISDEYAKK